MDPQEPPYSTLGQLNDRDSVVPPIPLMTTFCRLASGAAEVVFFLLLRLITVPPNSLLTGLPMPMP